MIPKVMYSIVIFALVDYWHSPSMRACDRRSMRLGYQSMSHLLRHRGRFGGHLSTSREVIRGITVSKVESLSYIRKSKARGSGSSGNGRDASGRHPRSESVAFGLSMNGNCTSNMHTFQTPTSFFFQISHISFGDFCNSMTINILSIKLFFG